MLTQIFQAPVAATIFVITIITSIRAFSDASLRYQFTYNPYRMVREGRWPMILTHGLVHGGWVHLIFNMLAFYFFAFNLEAGTNPVPIEVIQERIASANGQNYEQIVERDFTNRNLGHWQFAVLYIVSLAAGAIPGLVRHRNDSWYNAVGASGAISAVVLSAVIMSPEIGIGLLLIPGHIPGWIFALLFLGFSFFASFRNWGNIAHDAHLFGAIAGIILTVLLKPEAATDFLDWLRLKFG